MKIRELREDELYKKHEAGYIAFNYPVDMQKAKEEKLTGCCVGAFEDDNETIMSKVEALEMKTSFWGEYIPSLGIAGVTTKPEYRRSGCVRAIFSYLFNKAKAQGWEISYLYPFSYNYYRQFGFERICDSFELELQVTDLSFLPMNTSVKIYDSVVLKDDILSIYLSYGADKNCLIYPDDKMYQNHVCDKPYQKKRYTYIWYGPDKKPGAYISFVIDESILNVNELIYTNRESLEGILGFLRTFEGQVKTLRFIRIATDSPLLLLLKEFRSLGANLSFNSMGRVLNAQKLLSRVKYSGSGVFSVKVSDSIAANNKIFTVEYDKTGGSVSEKQDGAYDAAVSIQALTQIILGTDSFDLKKAAYLLGFEAANPKGAETFLRAFPKHSISMLEHF